MKKLPITNAIFPQTLTKNEIETMSARIHQLDEKAHDALQDKFIELHLQMERELAALYDKLTGDCSIDEAPQTPSEKAHYDVYTDGSFDENTKTFSCGIVILKDGQVIEEIKDTGQKPEFATARNIAGEIMGAVSAVAHLKDTAKSITIYHDYEGLGKWFYGDYAAKTPVSRFYVEYMSALAKIIDIKLVHVPAHSGIEYNERADKLARQALGKK